MPALKIKGPKESWLSAWKVAVSFSSEYPDRMGVRDGVGYSHGDWKIYVYRTKTQIVAYVDA